MVFVRKQYLNGVFCIYLYLYSIFLLGYYQGTLEPDSTRIMDPLHKHAVVQFAWWIMVPIWLVVALQMALTQYVKTDMQVQDNLMYYYNPNILS